MQRSKILCFNIGGDSLKKLRRCADEISAESVAVPQSDFSQTVGALLGVLPKSSAVCMAPFKESMLIMAGLERKQMERFLDLLREENVKIPYKAMVTPTNLTWQCDALIKELKKEHEQIRSMQQNHE